MQIEPCKQIKMDIQVIHVGKYLHGVHFQSGVVDQL